VQDRRYVSINH